MAGITNFRPGILQAVEVGFVIVTEDLGGGMVDIHDWWTYTTADQWF